MLARSLFPIAVFLIAVSVAQADPIALSYNVAPSGPSFLYNFTLTATQVPDPNVGFGWIIFGDVPSPGPSPINDFSLVGSIVTSGGGYRLFNGNASGPWTAINLSSGGHNGPTLDYVLDLWTPSALGDTVNWSGTSSQDMTSMLWSSIQVKNFSNGNFSQIQFVPANSVPEPATVLVIGLGAVGLFFRRRKTA